MNLLRHRITALVLAVALAGLAAGGSAHSHDGTEMGGPACAICHAAHTFAVLECVAPVWPPAIEATSVPATSPNFVATQEPSDVSTRGPPASPAI